MRQWRWAALLGGLLLVAILLSWADSTLFRSLFPQANVLPGPGQIRGGVLPRLPGTLPPGDERRDVPVFAGLGPVGGVFAFWWFLSTGAGVILLALAVLAVVPARARRAAERLSVPGMSLMFAAGIAATLLAAALTVLMRVTFVLLSLAPVVWAVAAAGALFGIAVIALATGRWFRARLGSAPVLVPALAGLLLFFDLALVPVAGWLVLLLLAITGLGVAVLTRLGSASGWGLDELNW
jgi:hypothetical protein